MTDQVQPVQAVQANFHFIDEDAVLTPPQAEKYLKQVSNELGRAQLELKKLRYQELKLDRAYTEAKTTLLFSEDCPKVGRSEGCVTVDERDAWVNSRIPDYWPFRSAEVQRRNAEDYLKRVSKQASIAQSLNNAAKDLYGLGGRS